jgi:hypothetical protein
VSTAAAHAAADLRLAATARTHLARAHRALDDDAAARALLEQADRWYAGAGGGDGSLLARCLLLAVTLAALDTVDGAGPRVAAELESVLAQAVEAEDIEVQVLALDALARWSATRGDRASAQRSLDHADLLADAVRHLLDDGDRVDAQVARSGLGIHEPCHNR